MHYRLEDGAQIHTSLVVGIYDFEENKYVIETHSGSLYVVDETDMDKSVMKETKRLMQEIKLEDDGTLNERVHKINDDFMIKKSNRKEVLDNAISWAENHQFILECFRIRY